MTILSRWAAAVRDLLAASSTSSPVLRVPPTSAWQALASALAAAEPRPAVERLRADGLLRREMPELEALFGVPQRVESHPEIDAGLHSLMSLEQAALLTASPEIRFGALVHDLGKGATPRAEWPRHKGHEERGVPLVDAMCRRLAAPAPFREMGMLAARWHGKAHKTGELRPRTLLAMLEAWDATSDPAAIGPLVVVGCADKRGRTGRESVDYPAGDLLRDAAAVVAALPPVPEGQVRLRRLEALAAWRRVRLAPAPAKRDDEARPSAGSPP